MLPEGSQEICQEISITAHVYSHVTTSYLQVRGVACKKTSSDPKTFIYVDKELRFCLLGALCCNNDVSLRQNCRCPNSLAKSLRYN